MLLVFEIALTVYGIVIVVRNRYKVGKTAEVTGTPARVIGIVMLATLPMALVVGFIAGAAYVVITGHPPKEMLWFALGDVGVIIFVLVLVTILSSVYKQPIGAATESAQAFAPLQPGDVEFGAPPDPENPYASPTTRE